MDPRKEKTKRSIYNAFIELRAKKPLEKLTVKELCEKALINKSTFYAHYNDIYDLSEAIEDEIAASVIKSIECLSDILYNPTDFTKSLFAAYEAHNSLITTVFSGTRSECLLRKIETSLKAAIFDMYPQGKDSTEINIVITYAIYGGFYASGEYKSYEKTTEIISMITEHMVKLILK